MDAADKPRYVGGVNYLPKQDLLFSAFTYPLRTTQYILFGESPYPRASSANGYAFWDAAVGSLWSDTGLSKSVNKATSLRNLMKMLLYARGDLNTDFSQSAIAALDTTRYHQTLDALFYQLLNKGFMLLNASLVYEANKIPYHARHWAVFMQVLLAQLLDKKPDVKLLLFGKVAEKIPGHTQFESLIAEHPYNISFITNQAVIDFFKPMDLLLK
ncbi:MAG: uracil-DNA glycosylase [Legionella sp.]|nr:uracil-DNA glycosylase [Legionella sp.]